jgi:acyl-CoA synthetase (AMP-forming)/AMP-acid ligase II
MRDEVRAFVEQIKDKDADAQRAAMIETGYVMPHWPKPYGREAGAIEQLVIEEEFAKAGVKRPQYGITAWNILTLIQYANPDQLEKIKPGTVGPLLPNTECRIVDPATGAELGIEEDGELLIRGPQVMRGYLNNPEATAATLDKDGWLHTGDIGRADADGYFTIVDRLKELIKYKGFQVAPAELEAVLCAHPAVADAAVIPIPDDECGEVPKAFVVLKRETSPAALLAYVAEQVAPYKKLRAIEVIDAIPKSPSGKILRRVLKERERAAAVS